MVDWPGCLLVVTIAAAGLTVRAEVGCRVRRLRKATDGLGDVIDVDLGDLRLEYREPFEVAWLIGEDHGDLREACERSRVRADRSRSGWLLARSDGPHADKFMADPRCCSVPVSIP